jgi:four helix bundle protein
MRDYTKYDIWKDGIDISIVIYELTQSFPDDERFGLISQLRRAAVSISSNFAEGSSRSSEKDFKRYIEISLGSTFEVKTQLIIAQKLGYLDQKQLDEIVEKIDIIGKQLNALRNKLL